MTVAGRYEIVRLGAKGDGVAETSAAAPLMVPGALPGDVVVVDESGERTLDAISPHRQESPCPYASDCGGCGLQHADDAFLARWRAQQIERALARQGVETEIAPTIVSPDRSRRRVGFVATRTKKSVLLGFHRARSNDVVDVDACLVARPEIMAAAPALRRLTLLAASRKRPISLHVTTSIDGLDLVVDLAKPLDVALQEALVVWVAEADADNAPVARITWNGEVALMRRPPRQRFGRALVAAPAGAFLQATLEGEAALVKAVRQGVGDAARIADLFSGCGTFALSLADKAEVLAVDADKAAVAALDKGWREADGVKRVAAVARDLFRRPLLATEMKGLDAIVFDPPRAGAEAQTAEIAASQVAQVVAVSCNPVSFARDAAVLTKAGFRLSHVAPVDQFRWSPHVELVGVFQR